MTSGEISQQIRDGSLSEVAERYVSSEEDAVQKIKRSEQPR